MNETMILCKFCSVKETCKKEQQKRQYEDAGWTTYCLLAKPTKEERAKDDKRKKFRDEGKKNSKRRDFDGGINN